MRLPRVIIGGTGSGCGKTTVTMAVLSALSQQGIAAASFKCGPDYIDPMFHTKITGRACRNLDLFMLNEHTVRHLFQKAAKDTVLSVIEGVMGYYDGANNTEAASTAHLAGTLDCPVILVMDGRGAPLSLAATVKGFCAFSSPNHIKGIILSGVSEKAYGQAKDAIQDRCHVKCYGYLPKLPEASFGSRHLGLDAGGQPSETEHKIKILGDAARQYIDIDGILALAASAADCVPVQMETPVRGTPFRLGVPKDEAFCFYYQDNLDLLSSMGAQLQFFSPLHEKGLPDALDGLYIGGGYPELYAFEIAGNHELMSQIRRAGACGMPILAECGGYMFAGQSIITRDGKTYQMAGLLPPHFEMRERLSPRFGYVTMTANTPSLLFQKGESVKGHEFHYSQAQNKEDAFSVRKANGSQWNGGCVKNNILGLYPHIHFYSNIDLAFRFVQKCREYSTKIKDSIIK